MNTQAGAGRLPAGELKLTLAIPTYNRARYLDVLLTSIAEQSLPLRDNIEIVVSDNASSDDTPEVVERHGRGIPIKYIRQAENIGADLNFARLFLEARGHYVWIIGDDDLLLSNALRAVIDTIDSVSPGIIFAKQMGFVDKIDVSAHPNRSIDIKVLDQGLFVERVNIFLSFISSIIVNKTALRDVVHARDVENLALERSGFPQYGWVLPAVLLDRPAVYIATRLVAARGGNAGGYAAFGVFIESHGRVLDRYLSARPDLIRRINNRTLARFFPNRIMRGKLGPGMVDESRTEVAALFRSHYKDNIWYWLLVWPLLNSPRPLRRIVRLYQWSVLFFLEALLWSKMRIRGKTLRLSY